MNIKTVVLSGAEIKVDGLDGQNTVIRNLGSSAVYASVSPGIEADADGVAEIPAGGGVVLYDTHGTVYLFGTGKVQLTGSDYSIVNFKVPSSTSDGDGSGGGDGEALVGDVVSFAGIALDESFCFFEEESV